MGAALAREHPVDADIVIGVPDSAIPAAIGYAREAGIPYREGLVKNRYVGRTFIQPDQRIREAGVSLKFNALGDVLRGKRVIVVDDSIVRGTTTPRVVALLRRAGAAEVHMRITTPPIMSPCFLGVDMATTSELIAANYTVEEIRQHIDADSLGLPQPRRHERSHAASPPTTSATPASRAATRSTSSCRWNASKPHACANPCSPRPKASTAPAAPSTPTATDAPVSPSRAI